MKGHQAVVGTCDVRNDRQATAELVDLLNAFAEKVYPETDEESSSSPSAVPDSGGNDNSEGASPATPAALDPEKAAFGETGAGAEATGGSSEQQQQRQLSVEEMIRKEADALRAGRDKTRRFQSVNTFVKGVVMVCVVDPHVDALRLVDAMFEEIRETRKRRSRFLERVTPMQTVAFSELEAFKTAAEPMVANALPPVAEGVPPLVLPAVAKAPAAPVADEPAVGASSTAALVGEEGNAPVVSTAIENATQEAGEPSGSKQPSEAPAVEAAAVSSVGSDVKVDEGAAPSAAAGGEDIDDDKKEATKGGGTSNGGSGGEGEAGGKTCDKRYRFRVDVRRRNSGLKRMDLINAVANSVGAGHSVSMATPDVRRRVRVRVPGRASKHTATCTFVFGGDRN